MQHRPEIDGLRAVAVLPVILFHAGFSQFSGGYIGVDVFFVISGYLITSILLDELSAGTFSLGRFYERRARRILPALFAVLLACLPFAYALMLPSQLADFSASMVTTLLALSNFFFLSQIDYFAPSSDLHPLLHTWTLAIEEQYYLLFPLLLLAARRLKRRTTGLIVAVLVLSSFAFAEWAWRENAARSFFFTLSRFWEIGAGSLCAFLATGKPQRSNGLVAAAGLAMIAVSVFAFDTETPFPSAYTLLPLTGTALVILFGAADTRVGRLLSLRAFTGLGLISYSAYLWHQPLFAFARLNSFTEPPQALMAALTLATIGLAWITWRYVERPFRARPTPMLATRRSVFAASALAGAVFMAIGFAGYLAKGFEGRLDPIQRDMLVQARPISFACPNRQRCALGATGAKPSGLAFIGDSHMGRYAYHLDKVLRGKGLGATVLAQAWCAPLVSWQAESTGRCGGDDGRNFNAEFSAILNDADIHTIVLAAEWANYTTGRRHGSNTTVFDFTADTDRNTRADRNPAEFAKAFAATIALAESLGKSVIVVSPVPEYDFDVPVVALRLAAPGTDRSSFAQSRQHYDDRNADVFAAFAAQRGTFGLVDVWPLLCAADTCLPFDENGYPLYNDSNHLSRIALPNVIGPLLRRLRL